MSEWDDIEARLEREEARLRFKAANLRKRHTWSLMAEQELTVADDIRSALEEIERRGLQYPDDLGVSRDAAGLSARCAELRDRLVAQGKRAEAAEAVLDIASREIDRLTKKAESAEAEVERLKGLLTKVMGRVQHRSPQLAREIIGSVSEDAEFSAALRGGGK